MSSSTGAPALLNPPRAAAWKRFVTLESPYAPPVFITGLLLAGHWGFGILESYQKTLLAIATSIILELALGRIFFGKFPRLASAYMTGTSVAILVRSPAFWPYALCSALSITSKYAFRVRGRHIFNPSNLGISALLFLAPEAVAGLSIQWGNYLLPMVITWLLGSVLVWRVRRFHITGTYVASFLAFAFLRSWMTGSPWQSEVAPITGPMYQLFIFFMITDPKTTVGSKRWECMVIFTVALVEMIMRLNQIVYAPFYALFIVGPIAMLVQLYTETRANRSKVAMAS